MEIGEIGQPGMTRGLAAAIQEDNELSKEIHLAWQRYLQCDWGELDQEDQEANNNAVKDPESDRILARYPTKQGDIYIITEHDRSSTMVLFCNEY